MTVGISHLFGGRCALLLSITAGVAGIGCESEVTLHLLSGGVGASVAGAGGAEAGARGEAGAIGAGDAESVAGRDGGVPTLPCQKLGAEVCNGGDDDCNGGTDESCTHSVSWQVDPDGPALGHVTIATNFAQDCPTGSVLVGLRVGMGTRLDQVAAICEQIAVHEQGDAGTAFSFTLGSRFVAPTLPFSNFEPDKAKVVELACPDGELLAGVDGTTGGGPQYLTQRIRLSCAAPAVADGLLDYDRAKVDLVGPIECTGCTPSPTYNYGFTIREGHVASGLFGLDGAWIDLVGFRSSQARIVDR